ncbi:MAG: ABC transporter ATP-binding protein [Armatimonadota bacterium]
MEHHHVDVEPSDVSILDLPLLQRLGALAVPYKWPLLGALGVTLIGVAAQLMPPWIMQVAIDRCLTPRANAELLTRLVLLYVGVRLVAFAASFVSRWMLNVAGQQVILDLRVRFFSQLQRLSLSFYDKRPSGKIISRGTNDVEAVNELLAAGLVPAIADLMRLAAIFVILLRTHVGLTLAVFVVVPLLGAVIALFRTAVRTAFRVCRKKIALITADLQESISGLRAIRAFVQEPRRAEHFDELNRDNYRARMDAVRVFSRFFPSVDTINAIGLCTVLWYGGHLVLSEQGLTIGILALFMLYLNQFFMPIRNLTGLYSTLQSAMAGAERVFEVIDTTPEIRDADDARALPPVAGAVSFQGVHFAYDGEPVLHDISFDVAAGETVALVGPTGAGKTTVVNLLTRMYDVLQGSVRVDGHDVRQVKLDSLRGQMGIVLQDPFLFSGSIRDNMAYGRPDAPEEEIREVARAVGAADFIEGRREGLEEGYDADVGERGGRLSVGQRQLVSFARALVKDPRILILDEATSSVDTETERMIQDAMRRLLEGRTALVIAHRLSTVVNADRIIVLDEGRIVAEGSHEELLERSQLYRELYEMQFVELEDTVALAELARRQWGRTS